MRLLTGLFCLLSISLVAQDSVLTKPITGLTASLHYASIFAHSKDVQNTSGANPIGLEFLYTKQRKDEAAWQLCNCYLNKGFGINYFNYDNRILGEAAAVFYVLEPQFKLSNRLKFLMTSSTGFSFLSNPYHKTTNPNNMSYSLPVSFYVGLGSGLQYQLSEHFQLGLIGHYLHVSNGGLKDPNKGINWPSANLRLTYNLQPNTLPSYTKKQLLHTKQNKFSASFFHSTKTAAPGEKKRHFIYGLQTYFSRSVSTLHAFSFGGEFFIDHALQEKLKRNGLNKSHNRAGLLVGHEFLFGKFIFSQQLGYYVYSPSPYFTKFYHRWGLLYYTNSRLALGFNLLAHAQVANFLDLRITYTLNKVK